jgi:hypothetical protein
MIEPGKSITSTSKSFILHTHNLESRLLASREFPMESDPTKASIEPAMARMILNYFSRHPRAADTLEGIARWRLMEEQVQRVMEDTREAIEWLISKGYLKEQERPYSGSIYSLNEGQAREIERFLNPEKQGPAQERGPG